MLIFFVKGSERNYLGKRKTLPEIQAKGADKDSKDILKSLFISFSKGLKFM